MGFRRLLREPACPALGGCSLRTGLEETSASSLSFAVAAFAKDKEDADVSPSPVRKAHTAKSSHTRSRRTRPKPEEEELTPAPTEYTPDGIPKTSAASVIVVDANTGKTLYEKNADQIRAPSST